MRPTLELLGELAEQTRSLVQVELSLLRAELRERGASISSSLTKVGVGLIFLPIGLTLASWRSAWRYDALGFLQTSRFLSLRWWQSQPVPSRLSPVLEV